MNSGEEKKKVIVPVFGPLTFCTVSGVLLGFAFADLSASAHGFFWYSHNYIGQTLVAIVVGISLGVISGAVIDSDPKFRRDAKSRLGIAWAVLVLAIGLYFMIAPAFQRVRE